MADSVYQSFVELENDEYLRENTLGGSSRPGRPTPTSGPPPVGQGDVIPSAISGVGRFAGHIVQSAYQSFVDLENALGQDSLPSRTDYNPKDALSAALVPVTGAIPAIRAAQAGETTLGVFGGTRGARQLEEQGFVEPMTGLRTYQSVEGDVLRQTNASSTGLIDRVAREVANQDALRGSVFGGIHRGTDGRLRFEMDDSRAAFTPHAHRTVFGNTTRDARSWDVADGTTRGVIMDRPLNAVLDHDVLYLAYPELKDTTITVRYMNNVPGSVRGSYDNATNHIEITASTPEHALAGVLHEVQHAVQRLEGFATGAAANRVVVSPAIVNDIFGDYLNKAIFESHAIGRPVQQAIIRAVEKEVPSFTSYAAMITKQTGREITLEDVNKFSQLFLTDAQRASGLQGTIARQANFQIYKSEAGEVEARAVMDRVGLSAAERRRMEPTGDIPREHQTISQPGLVVRSGDTIPLPSNDNIRVDMASMKAPSSAARDPYVRASIPADVPIPQNRLGTSGQADPLARSRIHEVIVAGARSGMNNFEIRQAIKANTGEIVTEGQVHSYISKILKEMKEGRQPPVTEAVLNEMLLGMNVPSSFVRYRRSAPDPTTGDVSTYAIITDPNGGPHIRVRMGTHTGHPRRNEIDAISREQLEAELKKRLKKDG